MWLTFCVITKHNMPCALSCLSLCDSMDSNLPGSSVYGIFQARILEWVPFPSPGDLPHPGIEPVSPVSSTVQADSLSAEHIGEVCDQYRQS